MVDAVRLPRCDSRVPLHGVAVQAVALHAVALSLALAAWSAQAQVSTQEQSPQTGTRAALQVTPTFTIEQTFTDSYRPDGSKPSDPRHAESITTLSPGVRIVSRSGWVQGAVDYTLSGVLYARDRNANGLQHRLAASGSAELVPNHLDLNAWARISQQTTSAFGVQSVDGTFTDRNQTEVRSISLQPVLRGELGGKVAVMATLNANRSSNSLGGGAQSHGGSLTVGPRTPGRVLGGSFTASRQTSSFDDGRETTSDRAIASVTLRADADLQLSLRGGVERSDLASLEPRTEPTFGAGLLWTPTPRTRVGLEADKRQFGHAHEVVLEQRFRRSVVRYTDGRTINDGSTLNGARPGITAYDLFFDLFTSQEPDAVARDALVRSFLERNGVSPDRPLSGGGYLINAITLQRHQELSFVVDARRLTWTASAYQTTNERADLLSSAVDDLSTGPIRQRGLSVSIIYRVTPRSGLRLSAGTQRTSSVQGQNTLDSVALGWNTRLGRQSLLSLTVRHVDYTSELESYVENALTAALSATF